jgi:Flp pilus assembly protein TadG
MILFAFSRSGAAASEFVLVLPVFILCLFSIVAFATALFMENNMVNAAREAVREMAVTMAVTEAPFSPGAVRCDSQEAAIVDSAEYVACTYLTFWGTDFFVDASDECPAEDKATVRISVDASQAALMDIFGFFEGKTLTAEVTMRKEDACV